MNSFIPTYSQQKLQKCGVATDYTLKSDIMFNRGTKPDLGAMSDKASNRNSSSLQKYQAHLMLQGTKGLTLGSTQTSQRNHSAISAQTQALALQQQQQQFLRAQNKTNPLDALKMASNIKEQMLIRQKLDSIKQEIEQRGNSKLGATSSAMGGRNITSILPSGTNHIPSTSNSSVVPTKQREDVMTKPDLSTLADTAVAVATATSTARSSTGMLGMGNVTKTNTNNITEKNQLAALSKESMRSSVISALSSGAMTDILRRDLGATRGSLPLGQGYKRSLDEMTKSNPAPTPSSWLLKSSGLGSATLSMAELRQQHEQLQRRNSLPARATSTASDFASLRAFKRQKLIDEKVKEIGRLEIQDAMKRVRQLDANLDIRGPHRSALLAEMASKIASRERRASLASSVASAGSTATAPNLSAPMSITPTIERKILVKGVDERSNILDKLSKLGGGFPMPKFQNESPVVSAEHLRMSAGFKNVPAEITPEAGKGIADPMGSGSLSLKQKLEATKQSRLGGFPMPPIYMHNDESQVINKNVARRHFDGTMNISDPSIRSNAISSHIRKTVNCCGNKASRPPSLESYKRMWREIRLVAGDDPKVDERLRKEVFARKLQRGEVFMGKTGNDTNVSSRYISTHVQQRRLSDLSVASGNGNFGRRTQSGATAEDSIVL